MSSRNKILAAIRSNQPETVPLPRIEISGSFNGERKALFAQILTGIGGKVVEVADLEPVMEELQKERELGNNVINRVPEIGAVSTDITELTTARELETVQKAFLRGMVGVAENGAVWIDQSTMGNRLLPFICQHLVLVLDANELVSDMHEAYARIKTDREGFGVFIAGPSKTADIEQSLVIGAHGPRSLVVYLKV